MKHHGNFVFGTGRVYSRPCGDPVWDFTLRNTTVHYPIARRDPTIGLLLTSFFVNTLGFSAAAAGFAAAATTAIVTTAWTRGITMGAPR